jgi:uncharacterized protein (DUF433 family)
MITREAAVRRTAHPHIVKVDGVGGGEAIVEGTRIAVWHLVDYYYRVGVSVELILADWDSLTAGQVFDALAYYHDNRSEIERARRENSYDYWQEHHATAGNSSTARFENRGPSTAPE